MADTFQFSLNAIRFEDVRAEIVRFLTAQGTYDAPLDFEGSNLAYIIDTMAYTTMMMSYMVSTVANDNFLDTTTLRKNAVSIAKTLGYKPTRIQASRIEGVFTYGDGETLFSDTSKITITPNSLFTGSEDGFTWTNTEPIVLLVNPKNPFEMTSAANETKPRITLVQGVYKKYSVLGTGKSLQTFTVPSEKIDENNMKVSVYTTQNDEASKVQWTHAKTFFDIQGDEIYFLEEDILNEGMPKVIFGNNIIGRAPSLTETIIVDYLETIGESANGEIDVEIPSDLSFNKSFDIETLEINNLEFSPSAPSFGGQAYETLDSIKSNAPRFFAAAGRAVTGNDFETLIKTSYGYLIDEVNVIGGDELEPGNHDFLGNAYIAAVPTGAADSENFVNSLQLYLNESDETIIINDLREAGIIATKKYFLKPSYIYLDIEPKIEISSNISAAELKETEDQAFEVLVEYFNDTYKGFNQPFRNSKVRSQVDAIENVISTDIDVNYGFILNRDSFYIDRESVFWLPVKFARADGQIVRGVNNLPETTNFIKKNKQIITDYNANNQSVIDLCHIDTTDPSNVTVEMITPIWHNRDVSNNSDKQTDHFWQVTLEENITPVLPVIKEWNILINNEDNNGTITIGSIQFTETYELNIIESIDPNVNTFLNDVVEVNNDFNVIEEDKINNINFTAVRLRRKFNKYNLLPEIINHQMVGRTSVHGKLTHDNLDHYIFNNDVYKTPVLKMFILNPTDPATKAMIQETFSFDGSGTNHYTTALAGVSSTEYNLYLNNTVAEDRKKVATLYWDKSLNGVGQFSFVSTTEEANWLANQGFQYTLIDGEIDLYNAFEVEEDENGNFFVNITLNSAISSIKLDEKNLLGAFTYDSTLPDEQYNFYDLLTRTFKTILGNDLKLAFEEDLTTHIVTCTWNEKPLFMMEKNPSGISFDFTSTINTTNDLTFNDLGLRPQIIFEPFTIIDLDEFNVPFNVNGFAIYTYGIFHDTTLGFFEYESGKLNFNRLIKGNYNGSNDVLSTAEIHIRDYFNNYGILTDDIKMDIVTIIPDNEYEDIDGFETVVGSQTDFDSIYTQTIRAKINSIESTQI